MNRKSLGKISKSHFNKPLSDQIEERLNLKKASKLKGKQKRKETKLKRLNKQKQIALKKFKGVKKLKETAKNPKEEKVYNDMLESLNNEFQMIFQEMQSLPYSN